MTYLADFWELRDILPRDGNGDPDWMSAQKAMQREFGVNNLKAMTLEQRAALKQHLRGASHGRFV